MSLAARFRLSALPLLALAGCDDRPGRPSTPVGNLRVEVLGLPLGTGGAVTVSGLPEPGLLADPARMSDALGSFIHVDQADHASVLGEIPAAELGSSRLAAGVLLPLSASQRNRSWEAVGLLDLLEGLESGQLPLSDGATEPRRVAGQNR